VPNLLFAKRVPQVEKASGRKAESKGSAVALVGIVTCVLIGLAVALYAMKQTEPARLVIDVALAFFAWSTGRSTGEKAGLEHN